MESMFVFTSPEGKVQWTVMPSQNLSTGNLKKALNIFFGAFSLLVAVINIVISLTLQEITKILDYLEYPKWYIGAGISFLLTEFLRWKFSTPNPNNTLIRRFQNLTIGPMTIIVQFLIMMVYSFLITP